MDKEKFFLKKTRELIGKLKIKMPVVRRDNRGNLASITIYVNKKNESITVPVFRYNAKQIKKMYVSEIVHCILHELGHIKTNALSEEEREYKAEKFAIKAIKKYYPKYYKDTIYFIKSLAKDRPKLYKKGFEKILKEEKQWVT